MDETYEGLVGMIALASQVGKALEASLHRAETPQALQEWTVLCHDMADIFTPVIMPSRYGRDGVRRTFLIMCGWVEAYGYGELYADPVRSDHT